MFVQQPRHWQHTQRETTCWCEHKRALLNKLTDSLAKGSLGISMIPIFTLEAHFCIECELESQKKSNE